MSKSCLDEIELLTLRCVVVWNDGVPKKQIKITCWLNFVEWYFNFRVQRGRTSIRNSIYWSLDDTYQISLIFEIYPSPFFIESCNPVYIGYVIPFVENEIRLVAFNLHVNQLFWTCEYFVLRWRSPYTSTLLWFFRVKVEIFKKIVRHFHMNFEYRQSWRESDIRRLFCLYDVQYFFTSTRNVSPRTKRWSSFPYCFEIFHCDNDSCPSSMFFVVRSHNTVVII